MLLTHNRLVPGTARYAGAPVIRINSAGFMLTKTCGAVFIALPGTLALTSFQLSSAGSVLKPAGRVPAGDQGPSRRSPSTTRRCCEGSSLFVGVFWNRSQFVFTAYFRSFPLMGLQIGSPSMLTITAGLLLKKIVGGSAMMPSIILRHDLALVQISENPIERDDPLVDGNSLHNDADDFSHLLLRQGLEICVGNLHILKADQTVGDGHIGVGLELDRTERRLVACLVAEGHDGECHKARLFVPAGNLRLVDQNAAAARQVVESRPAAIDWRRWRRRPARPIAVVLAVAVVV